MPRNIRLLAVLATSVAIALSGAVATTSVSSKPSGLRPLGSQHVDSATPTPIAQSGSARATRLVIIGRPTDDFAIVDLGPEGDTPGDLILFADDLFTRSGKAIGQIQARCAFMFRDELLCDASFVLDGRGQIIVHGLSRTTFAVTGGTGEFATARGQLDESLSPTGESRFVFTLFL